MSKPYKILAEKYGQVNEIGFAPGMDPKDDPRYLLSVKMNIQSALAANIDDQGMLALPNGEIVNSFDILQALKKADTFKEVEKVFFDYGLDYFIHDNPE